MIDYDKLFIERLLLFCPCLEANKSSQNSDCKAIWRRQMDVKCLHLFHWNFLVMVEQMDPTYAYIPSMQCLQRGEFVYSLHPKLQLHLIFHSLKTNYAKNLLGLEELYWTRYKYQGIKSLCAS
jgi:hypothetical protein